MISFFQKVISESTSGRHNGQPIWKYMLNEKDFEDLKLEFRLSEQNNLDPRDATLYYAEWWKRKYNGGKPSKEEIFNSLTGNIKFDYNAHEFYKLARKGAQMLGIKWIKKQNTLYFRTLLLQGGLPLMHISNNHGKYQDFLLAVLEEQPETIEDFMFKPHIIDLLPKSSQNEIIYESCLEIVKSILNDDHTYDDLFNTNEALSNISNNLKVRKQKLVRKQRLTKPKNYWLLNKDKLSISLKIGLSDKYDTDSLSNILGFTVTEREYQFYINDDLICVFRRMLNGNYKTYWDHQSNQKWNEDVSLPQVYVMFDGQKREVDDFIQTIPNLNEPSLWASISDNQWRLIKGNGTIEKELAILFPNEWKIDRQSEKIQLYGENLNWLLFEGEVELKNRDEVRKYFSEVNSFDWTIVSQKPSWIQKSNIVVVQNVPTILVYDDDNKKLPPKKYNVWIKKTKSNEQWKELTSFNSIDTGCFDLKIIKDGQIAYDIFYSIGSLQVIYRNKSIDKAELEIKNLKGFEFKLDETPILEIEADQNLFHLKVKTEHSKIPTRVKGYVGFRAQKKLLFELVSPFEGMAVTDKDGRIIPKDEPLTLSNLYGLRILSTPNSGTVLKMGNSVKEDVVIIKEIKENVQPVISFKDEIIRLFYLTDAMNHENQVYLQLLEKNKCPETYYISGFSHTLDVENQFNRKVSLHNSKDELDLFAVPLNCNSDKIALLPLLKTKDCYEIPNTEISNQFIVISSNEDGNQLLPRFVNTDADFNGIDKEERVENYHEQLGTTSFEDEPWQQLLSYFNICVQNDIPLSTFDQVRALSRSSKIAARAFLAIGIEQFDTDNYILKAIPEMEKDLGFCFHWIGKEDWSMSIEEINQLNDYKYFNEIISLVSSYFEANHLTELFQIISGKSIKSVRVYNPDISSLRSRLGPRVLKELPRFRPKIREEYGLPISTHWPVKLLLHAPVSVAESINNLNNEFPIWAGDDFRNVIRRNIQYCQYIAPEFYKKVILHVLNNN